MIDEAERVKISIAKEQRKRNEEQRKRNEEASKKLEARRQREMMIKIIEETYDLIESKAKETVFTM